MYRYILIKGVPIIVLLAIIVISLGVSSGRLGGGVAAARPINAFKIIVKDDLSRPKKSHLGMIADRAYAEGDALRKSDLLQNPGLIEPFNNHFQVVVEGVLGDFEPGEMGLLVGTQYSPTSHQVPICEAFITKVTGSTVSVLLPREKALLAQYYQVPGSRLALLKKMEVGPDSPSEPSSQCNPNK